jgi:methylthioribose-1-phosphate isomerase
MMKNKLAFVLLALVSAELLILVRNAVAEVGTFAKAVPCVEANIHFMTATPILSLSSNPTTSYSKDMKLEEAKRKLIDAKNKGIIGNERHFFDRRALERSITPREVGEVIDSCKILEEQIQKTYPKLRYKIKGITSRGRELILIVAVTKEGYLYVKTGWEV